MTLENVAKLLAWSLFVVIVIVTLGPIGLRPRTEFPVNLERSAAFFALGLTFAAAYPRRIWWAACIVLICAIGLEVLQNTQPGRHGRELDAIAKFGGALTGLGVGWFLRQVGRKSIANHPVRTCFPSGGKNTFRLPESSR
jgi:hypothetical protein